jgi:thiol-disulfide isomerase/thioredoxin
VARLRRPDARIVAALLFLAIAVGLAVGRTRGRGSGTGDAGRGAVAGEPAPEIRGVAAWINSPPLTIASLRGRVVLVDFWTFSCINCIRTVPFVRALYARYRPFGLEIVGVHSPEFSFERVEAGVREATRRHGVTWPVAMDNDKRTWQAFGNHYWPHVYLIDRAGRFRFDYIGEGHDDEIQARLRDLLRRSGADLPPPVPPDTGAISPHITPEIYLGSLGGSVQRFLANREGLHPGVAFAYVEPAPSLVSSVAPDGRYFLAGTWTVGEESAAATAGGARLILPFRARDVYLVGGPSPPGEARLDVLLDGEPLDAGRAGAAVRASSAGLSRLDLFHVIHLARVEEHVLTLVASSPNVALYTFTFG